MWSVVTLSGGEVGVEIDDVGASLEAGRGANGAGDARVEEGIGGDADGRAVDAARAHAAVGLHPPRQPAVLDHHLRRPALVLRRPPPSAVRVLQHAPPRRGRHGERAQLRRQLLAHHPRPCHQEINRANSLPSSGHSTHAVLCNLCMLRYDIPPWLPYQVQRREEGRGTRRKLEALRGGRRKPWIDADAARAGLELKTNKTDVLLVLGLTMEGLDKYYKQTRRGLGGTAPCLRLPNMSGLSQTDCRLSFTFFILWFCLLDVIE